VIHATDTSGDLFGHPKGLTVLFATEMWERFSYYGMRALLVLYMVEHLLEPQNTARVVGLSALKQGLEALFGPLAPQPLASLIYGLYTGLAYLMPIFGGLLADRWLGRRATVVLGAALMVAGHLMMAYEPLFLLALFSLVCGNGAFKPNISTQVGELYARDDSRRDRAYSIFYVGINIGAFFSPLICGTLGETAGWRYGFASAGVGMSIALAIYLSGRRFLPPETSPRPAPLSVARNYPPVRRSLLALALLFAPAAMFWAAYEQQGNTIALWAERHTDRSVDLLLARSDIPVTWFQAVNPLMIFLFTPPLVSLWARQARLGREPSTTGKLSLGCFGLALGYLVMALAAWTSSGVKAHWLWLIAFFAIITIAELYFSPIALSLVSRIAPEHSRSLAMGLWLTTSFAGNLLSGWLGGYWSSLSSVAFFAMIAAVAAAAGTLIAALRRPIERLLDA
jgi:POT family proton-dependent oligopeptide transporter